MAPLGTLPRTDGLKRSLAIFRWFRVNRDEFLTRREDTCRFWVLSLIHTWRGARLFCVYLPRARNRCPCRRCRVVPRAGRVLEATPLLWRGYARSEQLSSARTDWKPKMKISLRNSCTIFVSRGGFFQRSSIKYNGELLLNKVLSISY